MDTMTPPASPSPEASGTPLTDEHFRWFGSESIKKGDHFVEVVSRAHANGLETRLRSEQAARGLAEKELDDIRLIIASTGLTEDEGAIRGMASSICDIARQRCEDCTTATAERDAAEARLRECERERDEAQMALVGATQRLMQHGDANGAIKLADLVRPMAEIKAERDTLRAENERLRAALEEAERMCLENVAGTLDEGIASAFQNKVASIAREALTKQTHA